MATGAEEVRVHRVYRLGKRIGGGAFGDIYLASDLRSGADVAVKLESLKAVNPQLTYEARLLGALQGLPGIPRLHWFGLEGGYLAMVMELLGYSLEYLFNRCGRRLSVKSVCMIADELLCRLEGIHGLGFIHRDVKPDNFLVGLGSRSHVIHMVDYGLSRRYIGRRSGAHIPGGGGRSLVGTPRYASINNHMGVVQSRRDDLESLGYVLVYLARGSLPWQGIVARTNREKYARVLESKRSTPVPDLCEGLPDAFGAFVLYARGLAFDADPDYAACRASFHAVGAGAYDGAFDWRVDRPAAAVLAAYPAFSGPDGSLPPPPSPHLAPAEDSPSRLTRSGDESPRKGAVAAGAKG